jgi:2-iminobutanoate/2-iminopropanoate deaminase
MVYLAGCIGNDDQGKLVDGTIQDRTKRALFNAERRLQSVGLDLSDGMSPFATIWHPPSNEPTALTVVSVTIYLSKYTEDFAGMNEVGFVCVLKCFTADGAEFVAAKAYISCFPTSAPMPVRTCVGVKDLPAGTDIELTCVSCCWKRDGES